MSANRAVTKPTENVLAERLLAALERGDQAEAAKIQDEIFALHFSALRAQVFDIMRGEPRAHMEEVFSSAAEKMFQALNNPEKVRWVGPGESFLGLLRKIADDEIIEYWRGRPAYRDDRNGRNNLLFETCDEEVDPNSDFYAQAAREHDALAILEAAGGMQSFGGLLLALTMDGLKLTEIEHMLPLAQREDLDHAAKETADRLGCKEARAAQYLELIRECPSADPRSYEALKLAIYRARQRVANKLSRDDMDSLP